MALGPLRDVLQTWSPARGIERDPLHAIAAAWPAIVGDDVAAHSAPLAIAGTTLTIATESSAWSQQLQFLSERILTGVGAHGCAPGVTRLAFRAGSLRRARAGAGVPAPRRARRKSATAVLEPAADLEAALARLRHRMAAGVRRSIARCRDCHAPLDGVATVRCAPCSGAVVERRRIDLERLLYAAPWLDATAATEHVPGLTRDEFERARTRLLQRWWLVLERARRAGRVDPAGYERRVASSYVLLHSRLPPDRVTVAVVTNLLGVELEALLRPAG